MPLIGAIVIWPHGQLPNKNWRFCDGAVVSRTDYAELEAVIGDQYGDGGDADPETFRLPDLRGVFIRGADDAGTRMGAAQRDPDAGSRAALYPGEGGAAGPEVGSFQSDEVVRHRHAVGRVVEASQYAGKLQMYDSGGTLRTYVERSMDRDQIRAGSDRNDDFKRFMRNGDLYTRNTDDGPGDTAGKVYGKGGGDETRPCNVAVHFIIKVS